MCVRRRHITSVDEKKKQKKRKRIRMKSILNINERVRFKNRTNKQTNDEITKWHFDGESDAERREKIFVYFISSVDVVRLLEQIPIYMNLKCENKSSNSQKAKMNVVSFVFVLYFRRYFLTFSFSFFFLLRQPEKNTKFPSNSSYFSALDTIFLFVFIFAIERVKKNSHFSYLMKTTF